MRARARYAPEVQRSGRPHRESADFDFGASAVLTRAVDERDDAPRIRRCDGVVFGSLPQRTT